MPVVCARVLVRVVCDTHPLLLFNFYILFLSVLGLQCVSFVPGFTVRDVQHGDGAIPASLADPGRLWGGGILGRR